MYEFLKQAKPISDFMYISERQAGKLGTFRSVPIRNECGVHRKSCTGTLTAVLFTMAPNWRPSCVLQ